jgi:hypothetical protein
MCFMLLRNINHSFASTHNRAAVIEVTEVGVGPIIGIHAAGPVSSRIGAADVIAGRGGHAVLVASELANWAIPLAAMERLDQIDHFLNVRMRGDRARAIVRIDTHAVAEGFAIALLTAHRVVDLHAGDREERDEDDRILQAVKYKLEEIACVFCISMFYQIWFDFQVII